MAVAVRVTMPGVTAQQYDALRSEVGWLETPPAGGILHVVWMEDGVLNGLDVWESEEAFAKFGEHLLGPAFAKLGIDAQMTPEFHSAHEAYVPKAITYRAT